MTYAWRHIYISLLDDAKWQNVRSGDVGQLRCVSRMHHHWINEQGTQGIHFKIKSNHMHVFCFVCKWLHNKLNHFNWRTPSSLETQFYTGLFVSWYCLFIFLLQVWQGVIKTAPFGSHFFQFHLCRQGAQECGHFFVENKWVKAWQIYIISKIIISTYIHIA